MFIYELVFLLNVFESRGFVKFSFYYFRIIRDFKRRFFLVKMRNILKV